MKTPRGKTRPGTLSVTKAAKQAVLSGKVSLTPKGKERRLPILDVAAVTGVDLTTHGPFANSQGHMVVQVLRDTEHAHHIMRGPWGFRLYKLTTAHFDKYYKPVLEDPEACARYLKPIKEIGAPPDVVKHAARFIHVTPEELEMAEKKQASKVTEFKERVQAAKDRKQGTMPSKVKQGPKPKGEKKPKASALFKELILAGKLTDDAIFQAVKKEFGLDDKKRGYVTWYRNDLKKQGLNPPAAKT